MQRHLQLELPHDLRCRLALSSVYVSWFYISGHWDPDALARWSAVMFTCRLVSRVACTCAEATAGYRTCAGNSDGKARSRLSEWIGLGLK